MMLVAFAPIDAAGEYAGSGYRPLPAIYGEPPASSGSGRPLPLFGGAGTGGLESEAFFRLRSGYQPFIIVELPAQVQPVAPFAKLMSDVKVGFGRTMSRLPEVFGVSRQTLYNWLEGETPKEAHHARLQQLAEAARVFTELGFKPTSLTLDRTVNQGKSLLQLLSEGADGREAAKKLVRVVQRGADSRSKLDALLGDRKARPEASDMGAPSFVEDA
jgi:transcriptional regulator with XRE-family HTH domain